MKSLHSFLVTVFVGAALGVGAAALTSNVAGATTPTCSSTYTDTNNWSMSCTGTDPTAVVVITSGYNGSSYYDVSDYYAALTPLGTNPTVTDVGGVITGGDSATSDGGSYGIIGGDIAGYGGSVGQSMQSTDGSAFTVFDTALNPGPALSSVFSSSQASLLTLQGYAVALVVALLLIGLGVRLLVKWSKRGVQAG